MTSLWGTSKTMDKTEEEDEDNEEEEEEEVEEEEEDEEELRLMEGEGRDPIPRNGEELVEGGEEEDVDDDVFCLVQRMD